MADPWSWADQRLESVYSQWPDLSQHKAFQIELDVVRSFPKTDEPRGTGYVIDTIWSARRALEEKSFEDVVRTAILFGNDCDTTGALSLVDWPEYDLVSAVSPVDGWNSYVDLIWWHH